MTRRIFEFLCPDNHKFDRLIDDSERTSECKTCGKEAKRIISAVRLDYRMGVDDSMPTMADKWAKMHKDEAKRQNSLIDPDD